MDHYSNGVGQKKRNIGIFVSDVTFRTCTSILQYREVNLCNKIVLFRFHFNNQSNSQQLPTSGEEQSMHYTYEGVYILTLLK